VAGREIGRFLLISWRDFRLALVFIQEHQS